MFVTNANESKMKLMLNSIASELTNSRLYLNYVEGLFKFRETHPDVIGFSQTFWSNTLKVYYDVMTMHLIRVYDQRKESVGLKLLLMRINDNKELFSDASFSSRLRDNKYVNSLLKARVCYEEFLKVLHQDIKDIASSKNEHIKFLKIIRDKCMFHRDEKVLYGERPDLDGIKLNLEEISFLISDGLRILNYYSSYFDANTHSAYMVGEDDYKRIFDVIQMHCNKLNEN
jgi:hypothetical protein